jgi:uncharacterized membrane protein
MVQTPAILRAKAEELEKEAKKHKKDSHSEYMMNSFSKWVMAAVMLMFFVGVGFGGYAIICRGEAVETTLDYIMQLARIVCLGYFIKAFGENIAKIVLSAVFNRHTESGRDEGGF